MIQINEVTERSENNDKRINHKNQNRTSWINTQNISTVKLEKLQNTTVKNDASATPPNLLCDLNV